MSKELPCPSSFVDRHHPRRRSLESSPMNILAFVLVVFVGVVGIIDLIQSSLKSLIGWALVAVSVALIVQFCTDWSHSVHV